METKWKGAQQDRKVIPKEKMMDKNI